MAFVSLSSMPSAKTEQCVSFDTLAGGLNLWELDYRLGANESPEMKNLMWRDGVLNCRDGQVWLSESTALGTGHACYERFFKGRIVAHIGQGLYSFEPANGWQPRQLCAGLPSVRGSFFMYSEALFYKTRGAYIKISGDGQTLTAEAVEGYVPITVINADPASGAGDLYQPENRLSGGKTVWYNAEEGVTEYHLPVGEIDRVDRVEVDGAVQADSSYSVDRKTGTVTFLEAPPVTDPPTNNTVRITYTKANEEAMRSIMDCVYAETYGGTGSLCVVMAGCAAQPNAYFWNGNNVAMDAGYFPMQQYQLAGDSDDPISGFGKQQSYLVVFKENAVGRASISTQDIDERLYIDLPYVPINSQIGCDLPWTIRLVENNLVWCNTRKGVHMLRDSSAAYENNIECLSLKVNGSDAVNGLLRDVREAGAALACACDDDHRYWVTANSHAWVWDYKLSDYRNPSWFYWTNIGATAFVSELGEVYHLDEAGRLTHFQRVYADYDGPIEKVYRFATQHFGGYDRLKNVNSIQLVMRSDTNARATLSFISDYGTRTDQNTLGANNWLLSPRNLTFRSLKGRGFAETFRRRPMCRRVRHFTMRLENNLVGQDLSIVSAQIFYTTMGKSR